MITDKDAFAKANNSSWKKVFHDTCTEGFERFWFQDGDIAETRNTDEGMILASGPKWRDDAHHMVLWTYDSFQGDLKIEFEFTRLDLQPSDCVNIIYIQATGSGEGQYHKDISRWNHLRKVPAMKTYFDLMHTYHISLAVVQNNGRGDYVRARRYIPHGGGLEGSELLPDYFNTGLFQPGQKNQITILKRNQDLSMKVISPSLTKYFHWQNKFTPAVLEGRVGLRLMHGRISRFKNFIISERVP